MALAKPRCRDGREKERRRKRLWSIFQVEQWASGCDKSRDVETANDVPWSSGHTNCVMIESLTVFQRTAACTTFMINNAYNANLVKGRG